MDPITLNLRVGRTPAASAPTGGELSAAELDANFTNLKNAADQLAAEKQDVAAASLNLYDEWDDTNFGLAGATAPPFAGSAVSSGTTSTAIPAAALNGKNWNGAFLRSSTTANGGYRYQTTSLVSMYFGQKSARFVATWRHRTQFTGVLVRAGFHDASTSADAVDGAYFEVSGSTASAKTSNNSTRTTHATTYTLSLDVDYTFDIEVNAAGTSARFRIFADGGTTAVLDVTITTNIPTTSARAFGAGLVATESSTTALDMIILYNMGFGTVEGYEAARKDRRGPAGLSAYQVAVANGFVGTEAEWLTSLESTPTPVTDRLTSLLGTDDIIVMRGSTPNLASLAVLAAYLGITPADTAPAAFTAGDWTAAATATAGEISFNLTTLPADGGDAITALEYRVGTGSAIAFTGTGTGVRVVTAGLTAGVAVDLQVRAVNTVGAGAWSDVKNRTPLAAGGSGPVVSDSTRAGPSSFGTTLTITPPAGMVAGDHLAVVVYGSAAFSSMSAGTWADRSPASWVTAGRRLLVSDSFASVPGALTATFGGSSLHEASVFSVSNILTTAALGSNTSTTGSAAGARDHAYTTTAADSLAIGYVDFIGGGITGADTADAAHEWNLSAGGGYNHAFAGVRAAAGSYAASLAPTGGSSASEYGWAEIGSA